MKKLLSLFIVLALCFAFLPGCAYFEQPTPAEQPEDVQLYFDVGSSSFDVVESDEGVFAVLKGYFLTNFAPDDITVVCNGVESSIIYSRLQTSDGYMLQFNQKLVYKALAKHDYPAIFNVYYDGWVKTIDNGLSLNSLGYYVLSSSGLSMEYNTEWTTLIYSGITLTAKEDNTVTINGHKVGASLSTFTVNPFVLAPGIYTFAFKVTSGEFTTSNGFSFGLRFADNADKVTSLPFIDSIDDVSYVTYVVSEEVTVDSFYINIPNDQTHFTDTVVSWSY